MPGFPRRIRENVHIVPLGVDTRLFRPRAEQPRVPGRIVTVTSADSPLKGLPTLLRAVAKLATERDAHLVVIGTPSDATRQQVRAARPRRPGHVRQRAARRGVRAAARLGRGGGDPVDVRGVLAARGGAHGVGHAAHRQQGRRAARGHRGRRAARARRATRRSSSAALRGLLDDGAASAQLGGDAAWPGSASGSPGPRSPPRPRRCTGRRSTGSPVADRRFREISCQSRRPRARPRLRRRAARLRGLPPRRPRRRRRPRPAASSRRSAACSPPCGRRARPRRRRRPRHCPRTRPACRSPTARSTRSSPPRSSSTSRTTPPPWRRSPGCFAPAAASRSPCPPGCRSGSAGRCPPSTTRSPAATCASSPARELTAKLTAAGLTPDRRPPRARPALRLLVAQVRGRRARRRAPRRPRLPPAACLGHHAQARAHPPAGGRAQPAHRQEPRRSTRKRPKPQSR